MEDCCHDAEGTMRALIAELKQIHSRDDLPVHAQKLQQLFNAVADEIIEARKYKKAHPDEESIISNGKEQSVSDQLRIELNRILHMEGGREVIEQVQQEAIKKLDSYSG